MSEGVSDEISSSFQCERKMLIVVAVFALLLSTALAITPATSRQSIDFAEDLILLRDADEPAFPSDGSVKTCTINRQKGFSLLTPGFADGMPGVNFVRTKASYINSSAVVCHMGQATNATGFEIDAPAITAGGLFHHCILIHSTHVCNAGWSTVVVDLGGSPCDMALSKYCPGEFQKGPGCWRCVQGPNSSNLKAAGCDLGSFKAFCGPRSANDDDTPTVVADAHHTLVRSGLQLGKICKSGNYTCATIEHFAAFAPAFGRRPYISETNFSLVAQTDYSMQGWPLKLSTVIAGVVIAGEITGGGYAKLEFPLSLLPAVNFSEVVNITLTLPNGRHRSKPRRFMRAVPPSPGNPTSTVQVDHESGGLLMDGVRQA